jgi:hypothetical protein
MKRSDLLVIAGLGIAGYYAYTKFSKTKQDNSIYDTTINQFKAPGQLVNDAINTTSSGLAFAGQSAASILSNNQAVPIIKQAGNIASALINPIGAVTNVVASAVQNAITPVANISTPSVSANVGKTKATLIEDLTTHTFTNAGTTESGFYNPSTQTFISSSGQGYSVSNTSAVKSKTATPFVTTPLVTTPLVTTPFVTTPIVTVKNTSTTPPLGKDSTGLGNPYIKGSENYINLEKLNKTKIK